MADHAPGGCRLIGMRQSATSLEQLSSQIFPPRVVDPDLAEAGRRLFAREARFVAAARETARDRLCRALKRRQIEPRQRVDRPPDAGPNFERAGTDSADQLF